MRYVFLLAAALAGVASLALVQAQAQTPAPTPRPTLQQCLAKCASCPARADGTIDPTCAMKQQNCKTDCESQ
jgi:hypothetical protein